MNIGKVISEAMPLLLQGLVVTIEITAASLIIAVVLGLLTCVMRISKIKPLQWLAKFYVWIIRGTPMLVQIFFIYFGVPQLMQSLGAVDFRFTPVLGGIVALSLNAGAYLSEIFRGGIQAVDYGQIEAARSLGMSNGRTMLKVVLPQAFRICLPSIGNQFIISLKDTSLISVISLAEIVYQAKIYIGRTMESFATWTVVGVMYLVVITLLTWLLNSIEKRTNYAKKG